MLAPVERMIDCMPGQREVGASYTSRLIRTVAPSMVVAVDLGALYGKTPHFELPAGVRTAASLNVIVIGYLEAWILTREQGWFGAVSYRVRIGDKHFLEQNHLIPQWALKQASTEEVQAAKATGQLKW